MLLHFALVLHFAAILITFCVNTTFCGVTICSRKRHVETSRREDSLQSSTVIKSKMARTTITNTSKVWPTQNTPALQASLSHYLFTESEKNASFMWHCYWKFVLRITNRNFGGPKVLNFPGENALYPMPSKARLSI